MVGIGFGISVVVGPLYEAGGGATKVAVVCLLPAARYLALVPDASLIVAPRPAVAGIPIAPFAYVNRMPTVASFYGTACIAIDCVVVGLLLAAVLK